MDSAGGIPRELIQHYNMIEVPISYTFDGENFYRENVDQDNQMFYEMMCEKPIRIPQTSSPNIGDWLKAFEGFYYKGYKKMIVTTISPKLSASYQNACAAKDIFRQNNPDSQIEVITSNSCAGGQAALEVMIARLIETQRYGWDELLERIKAVVPRVTTIFSVNDMTYMKAGGRIGGAAVFLSKLIDIKPVCEFKNGVVVPIKAVRGRKNALRAMVEVACSRIKNINNTIICVQNALCEEDARFMIQALRQKLNYTGEILSSMVCAAVGAHSGPGAIGIGFVEM